jgi:hypothetical protein
MKEIVTLLIPSETHYQIFYIDHMMEFKNVVSPNVTIHKESGNEL